MLKLLRWVRPAAAQTRPLLVGGLALLFVFILYFWRLGSLTPGLGPLEYLARQNSESLQAIISSGINAPYYLVQHGFSSLISNQSLALRLASASFALIILVSLFSLLRSWFGRSSATFAAIIFLTTPWLILTARSATPDIMYFWPAVLLAAFRLLPRSEAVGGTAWILFCVVFAIGLYTPGMVWLAVAAAVLLRRRLLSIFRRASDVYIAAGIVVALLILVPLAGALVVDPSRIKTLFLIPVDWPSAVESLKSIGWSGLALFWGMRTHVDITLDRLPIFNILQVTLGVFGVYAMSAAARRLAYLLGGILVFAIIIAGLSQNLHLINLGLPSTVVFMAAGLRYLYVEWRRVFPLNPFSKALALGLISLVVIMNALYGIRYSLIAWPNTPETRSTYVLK